MKNSSEPVYPITMINPNDSNDRIWHESITKREYFAAMAMQGLLSNPYYAEKQSEFNNGKMEERLSKRSVEIADELLTQLEK